MSQVRYILSNGVRVTVDPVSHVRSAAIGLWCKTGSRHEHSDEAGITHLIEHMLFKGTERRTAKQIAEEIEGRGGSLNAFTDRESTCYYCRVLMDDVENGIDVLSDMMRNSLIDPEELEREQGVVVEEIKRSEDEPGDHVHDLHLQNRWKSHPLGLPIIGTKESVSGFKREDIRRYLDRRYRGDHILLSVAGNVDPEKVRDWAEKDLGALPEGQSDPELARPIGTKGELFVEKDVEQVHFCIGTDGASIYDPDYHTQIILDAALGGSMSSRLFQEVREKRGLVYSIGSYSLNYSAGGAYTVYGGTSPDKWEEVQSITLAEFEKLRKDGLEEGELNRTKRNISGNLQLALESMNSRMMRMSRNELNHQREIPVEESLAKIEAVTGKQVQELAQRLLDPEKISVTVIGPKE